MTTPTFKTTKDPNAVLDYQFDWSDWLIDGDHLSASIMTVDTGLTKVSDTNDNYTATVWLSGGAAGETYSVVNHITTVAGREDDRTLEIRVVNK